MCKRSMAFLTAIVFAVLAVIPVGCQRSELQSNEAAGNAPAGPKAMVKAGELPASSEENRDATDSSPANSAKLINEARELLEMGNVSEAESKLKAVLAIDPEARGAYYYLTLAKERTLIEERGQVSGRSRIILTGGAKVLYLGDRPLPRFEPKWEALREMPPTDKIYRWENKRGTER